MPGFLLLFVAKINFFIAGAFYDMLVFIYSEIEEERKCRAIAQLN